MDSLFFLRLARPLFAFSPPLQERNSPLYLCIASKENNGNAPPPRGGIQRVFHSAAPSTSLRIPRAPVPRRRRCRRRRRRRMNSLRRAADEGSVRGSWESGRRGSAWRGGVTAARNQEKDFASSFAICSPSFSVCPPPLSFFSSLFLSRSSLSLLHQIKLAPFLRSHLLRASSRARPRAAMASRAPSPASAVDFLTLLTKLKVGTRF